MFSPDRLVQAREWNQLTQSRLAELTPEVSQPQLSKFEKGVLIPDALTAEALAMSLGVQSAFFMRPPAPNPEALSPQLRARSKLSSRDRRAGLQLGRAVAEEHGRLSETIGYDEFALPVLSGCHPVDAASEIRSALGFDTVDPIDYIVLRLERLGVVVVGLPLRLQSLDAFCFWDARRPTIGVLESFAGDRIRFSIAHELGHLVLHAGRLDLAPSDLEEEADVFASQLLAPDEGVADDLASAKSLSAFIMVKTRWGVSVKSLVRKARSLGLIDGDRALSYYKQISSRGWNMKEPGFVPIEKPRGLRRLAELRYGASGVRAGLSSDAGWSQDFADRVLQQHAGPDELPFERDAGSRVVSEATVSIDAFRARRRP